jgi:hypothetical protein
LELYSAAFGTQYVVFIFGKALITDFLAYSHGLYPLAFPSQKQIDAMPMTGSGYTPPDFKTTVYYGLLLLAAEL